MTYPLHSPPSTPKFVESSLFSVFWKFITTCHGRGLFSFIVLCSNWALSIWSLMSLGSRKFSWSHWPFPLLLSSSPHPHYFLLLELLLVGCWMSWYSPLILLFFPFLLFLLNCIIDFINTVIQPFYRVLQFVSCFYLLRALSVVSEYFFFHGILFLLISWLQHYIYLRIMNLCNFHFPDLYLFPPICIFFLSVLVSIFLMQEALFCFVFCFNCLLMIKRTWIKKPTRNLENMMRLVTFEPHWRMIWVARWGIPVVSTLTYLLLGRLDFGE